MGLLDAPATSKTVGRTEFYYDPADKPDGSIDIPGTTNWSGTTAGGAPAPAPFRVQSGRLVHTPYSGGGNSACYIQKALTGKVRRIGAEVAWAANALGAVTLIFPITPWSQGNVTGSTAHLTYQGNGIWDCTQIVAPEGGSIVSTSIGNWQTHGRPDTTWDGKLRPLEMFFDEKRSRLRLSFPDGTGADVNLIYGSPAVDHSSDVSNLAIFELFENDGTTMASAQMGAIWADSDVLPTGRRQSAPVDQLDRLSGAPAMFNVSGTMRLRGESTDTFLATLVGNVTTWYVDAARKFDQEIEVHFIQDATGSRTLSGNQSMMKLSGSLTLTTTPGKRDILRFRHYRGIWYETSRSLNVG